MFCIFLPNDKLPSLEGRSGQLIGKPAATSSAPR